VAVTERYKWQKQPLYEAQKKPNNIDVVEIRQKEFEAKKSIFIGHCSCQS